MLISAGYVFVGFNLNIIPGDATFTMCPLDFSNDHWLQ